MLTPIFHSQLYTLSKWVLGGIATTAPATTEQEELVEVEDAVNVDHANNLDDRDAPVPAPAGATVDSPNGRNGIQGMTRVHFSFACSNSATKSTTKAIHTNRISKMTAATTTTKDAPPNRSNAVGRATPRRALPAHKRTSS
ncbi:hypothetical protein BD410DRAFT_1461 [Rickenella mellea]|uniref:Uncharacterized protein n=1 Tax=Rickenella mellea TaxID=50990 RepID=A0A4R5XFX0_9AGAM|nr:hypothetical protein BD410DRAFT_1461 [Rickenella mellea]